MEFTLFSMTVLTAGWALAALRRDAGEMAAMSVDGQLTPIKLRVLASFANKRIGLLNHGELAANAGVLLKTTKKIHTFGMGFPIDVMFLDSCGSILATEHRLQPGAVRIGPRGTSQVIELAPGTLNSQSWRPGGKVQLWPLLP